MRKPSKNKAHHRGGADTERLYLESAKFKLENGEKVSVSKTSSDIKGYSMADHIARHKGRYSLVGLYARPGFKLLDFPCGSGYASEFLKSFGLSYQGLDNDPITVAYANHVYGNDQTSYAVGNLERPELSTSAYDIVACIEGIEHIGKEFQSPLVKGLAKATKPGGIVIISSPENPSGKSGTSVHNKDHKWELTKNDFLAILYAHFPKENVEIVTQTATLSTGVTTTCIYAVCHKPV